MAGYLLDVLMLDCGLLLFVQSPRLLICDEATSALDSGTEVRYAPCQIVLLIGLVLLFSYCPKGSVIGPCEVFALIT